MAKRISSLVTQFRIYDQAVRDWVSAGLPSLDDGKDVPVVMSTPDRAFASMAKLLKMQIDNAGTFNIRSIPLPFVSISPGSISMDPSRYHGPATIKLGRSEDWSESYRVAHPLPYNINYRVEFWAKNIESMNALKLWYALAFNYGYESFIRADMSTIWPQWGSRIIPAENEGAAYTVEIDADGEGHRVVRCVVSFTLKAWIVPEVATTKNVHRIIVDTYMTKTYAADVVHVSSDDVEERTDLYTQVDQDTIE